MSIVDIFDADDDGLVLVGGADDDGLVLVGGDEDVRTPILEVRPAVTPVDAGGVRGAGVPEGGDPGQVVGRNAQGEYAWIDVDSDGSQAIALQAHVDNTDPHPAAIAERDYAARIRNGLI